MLFSGQLALGPFIGQAAGYSVGVLLLLVCKGLAYGASMSGFRGGPVFPALFVGAVGGAALSHLPGLPLVPAVAMGMGGDERGDAPPAAPLGTAGDPAAAIRRTRGDTAGDRGGGQLLRRVSENHPGAGGRTLRASHASARAGKQLRSRRGTCSGT